MGKIVRNICSDADKIEAIGMIGVQRCLQYSMEMLKKNNVNVDDQVADAEVLITRLIEHGQEKLFILKDEYVVTVSGKELAKPSHDAMVAETKRLSEILKTLQQLRAEGQEMSAEQLQEALGSFEGGVILLAVLAEGQQ